jgi:hypothetical protein
MLFMGKYETGYEHLAPYCGFLDSNQEWDPVRHFRIQGSHSVSSVISI